MPPPCSLYLTSYGPGVSLNAPDKVPYLVAVSLEGAIAPTAVTTRSKLIAAQDVSWAGREAEQPQQERSARRKRELRHRGRRSERAEEDRNHTDDRHAEVCMRCPVPSQVLLVFSDVR